MQPLNDLIDLGLNLRNSRRKRSVDGAIPASRIRVNVKADAIQRRFFRNDFGELARRLLWLCHMSFPCAVMFLHNSLARKTRSRTASPVKESGPQQR
jgi:hypothetical protein